VFLCLFALIEAEAPVPLVAYVAVAAIGACVVWVVLGRDLFRAALNPFAPAFLTGLAASSSIVLALAMVLSLGYQTRFFVRHDLRELGTASQPLPVMPEALVRTARNVLKRNDRWALVTENGRCEVDLYRYLWLEFRLLPNIPDCQSPDIELFFNVRAPTDVNVVNTGSGWAIVRR
jgi:hypothetical protein